MVRLHASAFLLLHGIAWGQSLHPVSARPLPALVGDGADRAVKAEQSLADTASTALDLIGIQTGTAVAEVGASTGEFTWRLAERVGSAGKVLAVETQPAALDRIRKVVAAHGFNNVKITRATGQDPKLPAAKIDLVLLAGSYHTFPHPQEMLRRIHEALKPEGKLVVIEYRKEDATLDLPADQRMTVQQIRAEIEPERYKFDKVIGVLPREHIVIFSRAR